MTDKLREAAQMALDALEYGLPVIEDFGAKEQLQIQHKAIAALYEALRAALAQPEEPDWSAAGFGKPLKQQDRQCPSCGGFCKPSGCERENVQPEQKHSEQWWRHEVSNAWAEGYEKGRASVKQPEQEPVAWCYKTSTGDLFGFTTEILHDEEPASNLVPLYTAPPQREWQGLTDEEIKNHWLIAMQSVEGTVLPIPEFALAIERALKEKNHG